MGFVAAVSEEARQAGVRVGLPLAQARRLCPEAVFRRGDLDAYGRHSEEVTAVLLAASRRVERPSADEAFVDLTPEGPGDPPPVRAAETIRDELQRRLGLDASLGLASSRLAARIASSWAKPRGLLVVLPGYEHSFVARQARLGSSAFPSTSRARSSAPASRPSARWPTPTRPSSPRPSGGAAAPRIRAAARGEQEAPIAVAAPPASLQEEATIRDRRSDRQALEEIADALARRAARRLKPFRLAARALSVEVRRASDSAAPRRRPGAPASPTRTPSPRPSARSWPRCSTRPTACAPCRCGSPASSPRPRRSRFSSRAPRPPRARPTGRAREGSSPFLEGSREPFWKAPTKAGPRVFPARPAPVAAPAWLLESASCRPASEAPRHLRGRRPHPRHPRAGPPRGPLRALLPQRLRAGGRHHPLRPVHGRAREPRDAPPLRALPRRRHARAAPRSPTSRRSSAPPASSGRRPAASPASRRASSSATGARCRGPWRPSSPSPASAARPRTWCSATPSASTEGIAVDTHVLRVTNRLGLVARRRPAEGRGAAHGARARASGGRGRPTSSSSTAARSATPGGRPAASARSSRRCRWESRQAWASGAPSRAAEAGRPAAPATRGARGGGSERRPAGLVAVVQMTSTTDVERNLAVAETPRRAGGGARGHLRGPAGELRLPALRGRAGARAPGARRRLGAAAWPRSPGGSASPCSSAASPSASPATPASATPPSSSGPTAQTLAVYRKIHLFDIDLPGMEHLKESRAVVARGRGGRGPDGARAGRACRSATTCASPSSTASSHAVAPGSCACPRPSPSARARPTGRCCCVPAPSRTWPTSSRRPRWVTTAAAAPPTARR